MGMAAGFIPIVGHLPEAGGVMDQSVWLMEAFNILTDVEHKLAPPTG